MTMWASSTDKLLKGEVMCPPKEGGALPEAGLSLGFYSPFQHCGGKRSVHTPSWHGSITLSSPSHEQHIENTSNSNSSQENREICRELNTLAYLSRVWVPRNRHSQEIPPLANYLQNCSGWYSPDSLPTRQRLLFDGEGAERASMKKCEKLTGLGKGKLRETSSHLRWQTGKVKGGIAERELAGAPNIFTQFRCTQTPIHIFTPIQISGCLIRSVGSIVKCWEGIIVLSLAWKARCIFYRKVSLLFLSVHQ